MNDGQKLLDKISTEMREGKSIATIEKAWTSVHLLQSYCENYHAKDKRIMAALEQLKSGLSTFTLHVRQGMPSPYSGFRVSLSTLRSYLDNDVDNDGWPKSGKR